MNMFNAIVAYFFNASPTSPFGLLKHINCKSYLKHVTTANVDWTEPWRSPWMNHQEKLETFVGQCVESRTINFLTGAPGSGKSTHLRFIANNMYKNGDISGVFYMYPEIGRKDTLILHEMRKRVCPYPDTPLTEALSSTKDADAPLLVILDEMDLLTWRKEEGLEEELDDFFTELSSAVDKNNVCAVVVSRSETFMDDMIARARTPTPGMRYKMEHTPDEVLEFIDMYPESKHLSQEQRAELAKVASKGGAITLVDRFFEGQSRRDAYSFEDNMKNIRHLSGIWLDMSK